MGSWDDETGFLVDVGASDIPDKVKEMVIGLFRRLNVCKMCVDLSLAPL